MTTRMLIDARHREETRVAVVKGNRIEEFDFESESHKQIKGNIYLARVTRVEPSLQAAFIEYGGNRHGFLAFSEIHPDYYQIPREDREALLREERSLSAQADEAAEAHADDADAGQDSDDDAEGARYDDGDGDGSGDEGESDGGEQSAAPKPEEHGGADDAGAEALRRGRMALRRRYKIQEVIKRRQVMLVQVVKEERGNKGAALTTYISLAGRYCVLMPNTAHGGGISRKIASAADRKRLKTIIAELNLPSSMGAIVRTAGLERTKTEIKRDFDYLTRLWDEIREKTLASSAPALIHEDSDLVKRAIRDVYGRDIEEVLVDGPEGYAQARQYMKLLMPSHAKKVRLYQDPVPLFHRAGVEGQLAAMMNPVVQLRSGGYIVINQTEALVAVDVNSGRSTREYNIEETALKTNCEAAEEVARQLRLRDLAGLIVIDFIDMESNGNNRRVERVLKDALKADRARIQVGRISGFGLMEMSRQRLRTGMLEASTHTCPMCDGGGVVRDSASAALLGLRMLEDEAVKGRCTQFRLRADRAVAVYALNRKRAELAELEERYGIAVEVVPDDALIGGRMAVDCSGPPPMHAPQATGLASATVVVDDDDDLDVIEEEEAEDDVPVAREEREERGGRRERDGDDRRGGRRRRRRGRREDGSERDARDERDAPIADGDEAAEDADVRDDSEPAEAGRDVRSEGDDREPRRRRRRRRRGGRRDGEAGGESFADNGDEGAGDAAMDDAGTDDASTDDVTVAAVETLGAAEADTAMAPEAAAADPVVEAALAMDVVPVVDQQAAAEAPAKPKRTRRKKADVAAEAPAAEAPVAEAPAAEAPAEAAPAEAAPAEAAEAPAKPKRTRRKKADPVAEAAPAEAAPAEAALPEAAMQQAGDGDVLAAEAQPEATAAAETPVADTAAGDAAGSDGAATPEAGEAAAPRRGWWQRTFG